jgi:hypothetical protein
MPYLLLRSFQWFLINQDLQHRNNNDDDDGNDDDDNYHDDNKQNYNNHDDNVDVKKYIKIIRQLFLFITTVVSRYVLVDMIQQQQLLLHFTYLN